MTEQAPTTPGAAERARALLFLGVAVGAVVAILVPAVGNLVPECAFRSVTGLYCPGCGTRRAMLALVQGDLTTALRQNAFAVVVVGPVLVSIVRDVLEAFGVRLWPRLRWPPALVWAFGIGVLVFWIARNLPFAPFTYLAPF